MSKPAARVSDMHLCPMQTPATPPIPHVGGPVLPPGEPRVLINGLPAARLGDMAVCVGPPDVIVTGSFTCLIGGKPAARMGDSTSHGGTIAAGSPNVLIGDSGGGSATPAGATMAGAKGAGLAFTRTSCAVEGATETLEKHPFLQTTDSTLVHFIAIEVVDPDGKPVPNEPFELLAGEGPPLGRILDAAGKARIDGIEPGERRIRFLNLEEGAIRPDGGADGALEPADDRTEPLRHTVAPGEHTVTATSQAQFRNWRAVWEDPANLDLRKARVNAFTLSPDDVITVPVRRHEVFSRSTDATHKFIATVPTLQLNLRLLDADRVPHKERTVRTALGTGGEVGTVDAVLPDATDGDGRLSLPLSPSHREGELTMFEGDATTPPAEVHLLRIGRLAPANTVAGTQMRLNNMGYFAGFTPEDVVQLRWAVEEFEFDNGLKPTGKFDDPKVFNRIAHVHGDLLKSETVP